MKYNPKTIMHFETAQAPNILGVAGGIVRPVGFKYPPGLEKIQGKGNQESRLGYIDRGMEKPFSNHVLHDHFYCCQISWDMCFNTGEPKPDTKAEKTCYDWHTRRMTKRALDAKRLNVPLMVTEFGACYNTDTCVREINQVLDQCERTNCAGWAYWQFK